MALAEDKVDRAYRLFYGEGMELGAVAKALECGIYDLSPWLTAPALRIGTGAMYDERASQMHRADVGPDGVSFFDSSVHGLTRAKYRKRAEAGERPQIVFSGARLDGGMGPLLTIDELARKLKVDSRSFISLITRHVVVAIPHGGTGFGNLRLPLNQFVNGKPVGGIQRIWKAIGSQRAMWLWLVTPHAGCKGETPLALLKEGKTAKVGELAEKDWA